MNTANKIMIVLGDRQWTLNALHLACAMVRNNNGEVILVKMVPVQHPIMLGTDAGYRDFTVQDEESTCFFAATAEDYGVPFSVFVCQYASYVSGIADVAEQIEVTAVFCQSPRSHVPFWAKVQKWLLEQALARRHIALYMLEQSDGTLEWTPSVTISSETRPFANRE